MSLTDKILKEAGIKSPKVIGKTQSDKPVYANKEAEDYEDFDKQDHLDAAAIHKKEAIRISSRNAGNASWSIKNANKGVHHNDMEFLHKIEANKIR